MESKKTITRRDFFKRMGVAGIATTGLSSCNGSSNSTSKKSLGEMTYRNNPTTGDRVSLLGYGCMRWPMMPNPDGEGEIVNQEEVNRLVDYAIEHGVNYFDTAPLYVQGLSETATGIALSRHPRNSYYIATKMSNQHLSRTMEGSALLNASIEMFHHSLESLRTEYIDYLLLHNVGFGPGMPSLQKRFFDSGVLDFLLKERENGRIRNLGFSYHGDVKTFDHLLSMHDTVHWNFVQIQLNYIDWKHASGMNFNAEYLYGELEKRGIPAIIMEPLRGGRLASLPDYLNVELKQRRPDDSIASWAFRFAATPPGVLTVLSGMTYMEHLQDNLQTFSPLVPCTFEELEVLENIATRMMELSAIPCTACEYCMPCPYGINIPAIFSHYNKCVFEKNVPSSSQDENYRQARQAFLVGYDRHVPRLRQASHCIGCNQCVSNCPQTIKIPEELHRIDRYVEQLKQGTL